MTKFSGRSTKNPQRGVIKTTTVSGAINHEGVVANTRDAKSDLFLLGVMNFVSEDTFYESGATRDTRFEDLVHIVTQQDPEWVAKFVEWLRAKGNMRSASIVAACEYVRAGGTHGRAVIKSACLRADEPAEALAYWMNRHGRNIPAAVKRGVADAVRAQYTEYSLLKYDTASRPFRFADVIQLVHPSPSTPEQDALFKAALDRRYGGEVNTENLPMVQARAQVEAMDRDELLRSPDLLKRAGLTWEYLSGRGPMDARAWEAMIPTMGYMALLRNLRNFDEAGISSTAAQRVIAKLTDPKEVARSRQLPFRFWSAYKNTHSTRWMSALDTALGLSLKNIPVFSGKTYVSVDTSASMSTMGFSARSTVKPVEAGAIFGVALALAGGDVRLTGFADGVFEHPILKGSSLLREVDAFAARIGERGHGTNISGALRAGKGADRAVIVTDMQTQHRVTGNEFGAGKPVYGFNLGGYSTTVIGDGRSNQFEFGGLTDATFSMIPLIEAGRKAVWPWEEVVT